MALKNPGNEWLSAVSEWPQRGCKPTKEVRSWVREFVERGWSKGEDCWKEGMKEGRGSWDCRRKMHPTPLKILPNVGTTIMSWIHMKRQISKGKKSCYFFSKFFPCPNTIFTENWNFILATVVEIKIPANEHGDLGRILGKNKSVLLIMIYLRQDSNVCPSAHW